MSIWDWHFLRKKKKKLQPSFFRGGREVVFYPAKKQAVENSNIEVIEKSITKFRAGEKK